jgi:hypothetical protein
MSRAQLGELRDAIARVIAVEKAYNVPALCVRLGLDDGEVSEAMSSKARYASARLAKLPVDRLIAFARALLEETDDFALREVTDRIAERDTPPISDLTRRRLLSVYEGCEICTEYDEIRAARADALLPVSALSLSRGFGPSDDRRRDNTEGPRRAYQRASSARRLSPNADWLDVRKPHLLHCRACDQFAGRRRNIVGVETLRARPDSCPLDGRLRSTLNRPGRSHHAGSHSSGRRMSMASGGTWPEKPRIRMIFLPCTGS